MIDRDAYVEKAKANIDKWNAEIDKMQANAKEAQADAKIKYEKQLAEMRKQRDEAEAKMKEAQQASDAAWDHAQRLRAGMGQPFGVVPECDEAVQIADHAGTSAATNATRSGSISVVSFMMGAGPATRSGVRGRAAAPPER